MDKAYWDYSNDNNSNNDNNNNKSNNNNNNNNNKMKLEIRVLYKGKMTKMTQIYTEESYSKTI